MWYFHAEYISCVYFPKFLNMLNSSWHLCPAALQILTGPQKANTVSCYVTNLIVVFLTHSWLSSGLVWELQWSAIWMESTNMTAGETSSSGAYLSSMPTTRRAAWNSASQGSPMTSSLSMCPLYPNATTATSRWVTDDYDDDDDGLWLHFEWLNQ